MLKDVKGLAEKDTRLATESTETHKRYVATTDTCIVAESKGLFAKRNKIETRTQEKALRIQEYPLRTPG